MYWFRNSRNERETQKYRASEPSIARVESNGDMDSIGKSQGQQSLMLLVKSEESG